MKIRLSILSVLLFCSAAVAQINPSNQMATIVFAMTNAVGRPDTNYFLIYSVDGAVLANGGVRTIGFAQRCYPNTNGIFFTNLMQGFYQMTNAFLGKGIIFQVPADTNSYTVDSLGISGFNTYRPSGVIQLTSLDASVSLSPLNGKGVVDLSAHGGGGSGNGFPLQSNANANLFGITNLATLGGSNGALITFPSGTNLPALAVSNALAGRWSTPTNQPFDGAVQTATGTGGDTAWEVPSGGSGSGPWTNDSGVGVRLSGAGGNTNEVFLGDLSQSTDIFLLEAIDTNGLVGGTMSISKNATFSSISPGPVMQVNLFGSNPLNRTCSSISAANFVGGPIAGATYFGNNSASGVYGQSGSGSDGATNSSTGLNGYANGNDGLLIGVIGESDARTDGTTNVGAVFNSLSEGKIGTFAAIYGELRGSPIGNGSDDPKIETAVAILDNRETGTDLQYWRTNNGTHVASMDKNGTVTANAYNSLAVNTSMTCVATGCTNNTGIVQVIYVTAATGAALTDNAGNTEFSSVTIAAFTPIRIQNGGTFTGTSITYASGAKSHGW